MSNARSGALWLVATLCTVNLSACNTVKGLGADMQNLGQKIARKIDQKDASDATRREVRLEVQGEAQTGQKEGQKASEHRENQNREGTNTDYEVDNAQNELGRMYEEQMQRRAQ